MRWLEVDDARWSAWRDLFNLRNEGLDVRGCCPVCGNESLHHWYHRRTYLDRTIRGERFTAQGPLWEWCSTCGTYAYLPDGLVPAWWQAELTVDELSLVDNPEPIERARTRAADG